MFYGKINLASDSQRNLAMLCGLLLLLLLLTMAPTKWERKKKKINTLLFFSFSWSDEGLCLKYPLLEPPPPAWVGGLCRRSGNIFPSSRTEEQEEGRRRRTLFELRMVLPRSPF